MSQFYLKMNEQGVLVLDNSTQDNAPLQIAMSSGYAFDSDVQLIVSITDTKEIAPTDDPLHNLEWVFDFVDITTNQSIETISGRLFTGGGLDELALRYSQNPSYAVKKMDFLSEKSDIVQMTTYYDKAQADTIKSKLPINQRGTIRPKTMRFSLEMATENGNPTLDSTLLIRQLADLDPDYIALTNVDDFALVEVAASVVQSNNCHAFIELGELTDVRQVVSLANSLNIKDHKIRFLWNATVSRGRGSMLAKKGYRPCVGDYLAKHLARNAIRNNDGIPPIHIPIAGYDFPVLFNDISMMDGVHFDAETENMLANAGVIVLKAEKFGSITRFVYADVLTQYDSENSALRLSNASEIATFTAKTAIGIAKRYLLSNTEDYKDKVESAIVRFANQCVAAGLLMPAEQLGGKYYHLEIKPKADKPFEAMQIYFARKPVGAVRLAELNTTINR